MCLLHLLEGQVLSFPLHKCVSCVLLRLFTEMGCVSTLNYEQVGHILPDSDTREGSRAQPKHTGDTHSV